MKIQQSIIEETVSEARVFLRWAISSLLDSVFVAIWAIIQWLAGKILAGFPLQDIDLWVFWAFRIIFAITTLIPIAIYIYEDIMVMAYRSARRIREERDKK